MTKWHLHLSKLRRKVANLKDVIIFVCFQKLLWLIFGLILILHSKLDLWNWIRPWRLNKFGVLGIVDQPCIIKKHSSFKPLRKKHRWRVTSAHAHSCWSLRVAHETSSHFPVTAFQAHHKYTTTVIWWRVEESVKVLKATEKWGVVCNYYSIAMLMLALWVGKNRRKTVTHMLSLANNRLLWV